MIKAMICGRTTMPTRVSEIGPGRNETVFYETINQIQTISLNPDGSMTINSYITRDGKVTRTGGTLLSKPALRGLIKTLQAGL